MAKYIIAIGACWFGTALCGFTEQTIYLAIGATVASIIIVIIEYVER